MAVPASPAPLRPFVLLDDARASITGGTPAPARLFTDPVGEVRARTADEVAPALEALRAHTRAGRWCAGYLAYEAGLALEPRLAARGPARTGADGPLLWFGVFEACETVPAAEVPARLAAMAEAPGHLGPMAPQLSPGGYARAFDAIAEAIARGDIYQANLTFPLAARYGGSEVAIYAALRARAGGGHSALVCDGAQWTLSFSPELFFALDGRTLVTRPMKGTRPRGPDPAADEALRAELAASPKDRAENLMIVDLLRNDMSRVAVPGSVRVHDAFAIESYPSVHQMVTGISAELAPEKDAIDALAALFPCGSITGAPKIRAMELIDATERDPRGVYCGAIGHLRPIASLSGEPADFADGGAGFNVAIRTLRLAPERAASGQAGGRAVLGVGSAVVADSGAMAEWRECMVKGGFVRQQGSDRHNTEKSTGDGPALPAATRFDLIETMAFTPEAGIPLFEHHLARMTASAAALGFAFDRHAVRNAVQALCFETEGPARVRIVLAQSGAHAIEVAEMPAPRTAPLACVALPHALDPSDLRLAHKTSDRGLYDKGLAVAQMAGADEALLVRADGLVTEGCFTSVFVERGGVLVTPPLALGLLPGVLRQSLLDEGRAVEGEFGLDALEGGFFVGNALRGLLPARLA